MAKIKVPSEMNLQCKNPLEIGNKLPNIWASNGGVGITPKLICSPANTIIQLTDENHTMIGAMQRYKQFETSDDFNRNEAVLGGSTGTLLFPYTKSDGTIIENCSIGPMVFKDNTYLGNSWTRSQDGFTASGLEAGPFCYVDNLLASNAEELYLRMKSEVSKIVEKQQLPLEKTIFGYDKAETYKLAIIPVHGPAENLLLFCLMYLNKDVWYYHGTWNNMDVIASAYQYLFLYNGTSQNFLMLI